MAEGAVQKVAILAIHPQFAAAILSGKKRVEFRKRGLASSVEDVVLYATAPVMAVVGSFKVAGIEVGSPNSIWERHKAVGGIARSAYRQYYSSSESAVAIMVGQVTPLREEMPLREVDRNATPPQSFAYVAAPKWTAAKERWSRRQARLDQRTSPHALS